MSEEQNTSTEDEVKSAHLPKLPDLQGLREARELTIEDIFLKTRISTAILDAIEKGEFHLLPAPLYTKKFIVIYADTIGVDAGIILAHYQRYLDEIQAVTEKAKAVEPQIADRKPLKQYILLAVSAVAIFAVVFIVSTIFNNQSPQRVIPQVPVDEQKQAAPKPASAVKEQPLEPLGKVPPTPPPAVSPKQAPPPVMDQKEAAPPASKSQLDLLIEAKEDTWIKVTEDHKPPYQTTLKKGKELSRNAQEFFIVDVGNAAGVNITFQGKSLGNLGQKGQVVHLRLPQQ